MNKFEELEEKANNDSVFVYEVDLSKTRFKGLYCDSNVALSDALSTSSEKACILAEELGHHYTTVGDITDQTKAENRKQERQARLYAYNKLIGLRGLIQAFEKRCLCRTEMAQELEVTEEFLQETINCYTEKYGTHTSVDNYIIFFIPNLRILKMI